MTKAINDKVKCFIAIYFENLKHFNKNNCIVAMHLDVLRVKQLSLSRYLGCNIDVVIE